MSTFGALLGASVAGLAFKLSGSNFILTFALASVPALASLLLVTAVCPLLRRNLAPRVACRSIDVSRIHRSKMASIAREIINQNPSCYDGPNHGRYAHYTLKPCQPHLSLISMLNVSWSETAGLDDPGSSPRHNPPSLQRAKLWAKLPKYSHRT